MDALVFLSPSPTMAAGIEEAQYPARKKKRKRPNAQKLLPNDKVEVRSLEQGFAGSWHQGTVVSCNKGNRHVKYDHVLVDNGSDFLVDRVSVSPALDGADYSSVNICNYRGCIRPLPPKLDLDKSQLFYGLCVDMYYKEAWWEGVVFDHGDGLEERRIFFPDLGDEMMARIDSLRITQDWNEFTADWKCRGTWLFLELIEKFKQELFVPVSVKQIWYEVRGRNRYKTIQEWTSSCEPIWKELVLEVINDNIKHTIVHFYSVLGFPRSLQQGSKPLLECHPMHSGADAPKSLAAVPVENSTSTGTRSADAAGIHRSCQDNAVCMQPQPLGVLPSTEDRIFCISSITSNEVLVRNNSDMLAATQCMKTHSWLPAGPDIVPKAKSHPEAILKYVQKPRSTLVQEVRMHLKYQRWRIEFMHDGCKNRFRYTSPEGKQYFSLRQVCADFSKSYIENNNSNTTENQRSLCALPDDSLSPDLGQWQDNQNPDICPQAVTLSHSDVLATKPKNCPQAVLRWWKAGYDNTCKGCTKSGDLMLKAKKHLLAQGWVFHLANCKSRSYACYTSPRGRKCYSLRQACKICMEEGGVSESNYSGSRLEEGERQLARKKLPSELCNSLVPLDGLSKNWSAEASCISQSRKIGELSRIGSQGTGKLRSKGKNKRSSQPTRVLRSSKRVQQIATSSFSHQIPQTILSWLIYNNVVLPRAKVHCSGRRNCRKPTKEGRITNSGIKCSCCSKVYTVSSFVAHAGGIGNKPAAKIFLKDGRSLLDCLLQLIRDIMMRYFKAEPDEELKSNWQQGNNDDICSVCHYGGELVLCDQCPSSFHRSCLGLETVLDGEWFCPSCCCGICGQSKLKDVDGNSIDDTVLRGADKLGANSDKNWFCGKKCKEIFKGLHKLLGKQVPVGKSTDNLTWTLVKPMPPDTSDLNALDNSDALIESYSKLNIALGVMHECFEPVQERYTGRDLVEDIIFNRGSDLNRLNFRGFYTVLLEKNDELITVATLRVFGEKAAELPLVGTRFKYRRRGMCHILMDELEKKLMELGVERLILPAVSSLLQTWRSSFGFSEMTASERLKFVDYSFLDFPDTIMCQKLLSKRPCAESDTLREHHHGYYNDVNDTAAVNVSSISPPSEAFHPGKIEGSRILDRGLVDVDPGESCSGTKKEVPPPKYYKRRRIQESSQ
ncbi:hypothetical protein SLEP1_g35566 [Rubroshorea leprosula]|uniref:PHD finger transcription factor n=1 Tax=Rubroshorea leprosula TaxID=152421 RepID=A0AAV5KNR9_9ROSI|nr:hypothetical protein SLEP1_g35566 [Rubroshorea leprosula]